VTRKRSVKTVVVEEKRHPKTIAIVGRNTIHSSINRERNITFHSISDGFFFSSFSGESELNAFDNVLAGFVNEELSRKQQNNITVKVQYVDECCKFA
jgi:hypothetical protein